ncbi:UNVERIFIED_CONTAM: hypothetical protein FKN15_053666 [Acipenser sinensis]
MSDDMDVIPEREMKDFQFKQMKKIRIFESPHELPKERCNLLAVSNKYGLTFAGGTKELKVFLTKQIIAANQPGGNPNEIEEGLKALSIPMKYPLHHIALSSDELTLSVCTMSRECGVVIIFYDVRTFLNKDKPQKRAFAYHKAAAEEGCSVYDLKWNPTLPSLLATCLSDGSLHILEDFQFKQMKKIRIFESPHELPKERCNLLAVSNKYGLTFAGGTKELKVFLTKQIIAANQPGGNPNEIEEGLKALSIPMKYPLHHIALSSDELTLSVCTMSRECGVIIIFYDVRTFLNKDKPQKRAFAYHKAAAEEGCSVYDLKWNPTLPSLLATCLSDGSLHILEVTDAVKVQAQLPPSTGITSVLDVLWLSTYVFAVAYAAADGTLETPPELVVVSLPKKDEKREERFLNFSDLLFGSCTERQHHYYLSHVEDWDMVLAASAGSIEVSIIAKQEDKTNWELWLLEDASRAELPVTLSNEDTLPVGVAIDYTSQGEIHISDEKSLPPAPILMLLSTDGVLCPFYLINQNPGAKQLITPPGPLSIEGERQPKAGAVSSPPPATSAPSASAVIPAAAPALRPPATTFSSSATAAAQVMAPAASTAAFSFTSNPPSGSAFSLGPATSKPAVGTTSFRGTSSFSFAPPNAKSMPVATSASNFSFGSASVKPLGESSAAPPGMTTPIASFKTNLDPSTPPVKLNLADRFSAVETPAPSAVGSVGQFAFTSTPKPAFAGPVGQSVPLPVSVPVSAAKSNKIAALSEEAIAQSERNKDQQYKQLLYKKPLDPRSEAQLKSLHGDIGSLKTTLLEGFAGAEEAIAQSERNKDQQYKQLLYKKPLDPRSEAQLKEIRRLYQYAKFAVEDVNDVLDLEWDKHLETKKKQRRLVVPERESLFNTLVNNRDIINQQRQKLTHIVNNLQELRLYNKTSQWRMPSEPSTLSSDQGFDNELENLRATLLKASLETSPVTPSKSPAKMSPVKQSQLRNFLSKRQTPPVRSTAPVMMQPSKKSAVGADSTALATKTVKHGAPPASERSPAATVSAQQAAAAAAMRRHMTNQTPVGNTSLTESTLKTVPQVVNVQELKDKGAAMPVSTVLSSSVPAPAAQVIQQVLATVATNQAKPVNTSRHIWPGGGLGFGSLNTSSASALQGGTQATAKEPSQASKFSFTTAGSKPVFGSGTDGSFSFSTLKPAVGETSTATKPAVHAAAVKTEAPPSKSGNGFFQAHPPGETLAPVPAPVSASTAASSTPSTEASNVPQTTLPAVPLQQPSVFGQPPSIDQPASVFVQAPSSTETANQAASGLAQSVTAAAAAPTPITTHTTSAPTAAFGQPPGITAAATASSGFGAPGFGSSSGFGKPAFGQPSGFGQPASSSANNFTFGQSAFGSTTAFGQQAASTPPSSSAGLFGSSSTSSASSFSFVQTASSASSSTGGGPFGQSTAPAFGQNSGFGQNASVFGGNTTTTSSSGLSFGQSSGFGPSSNTSVFGQQSNGGSVFGQQQASSGGGLFGSGSGNGAGAGGGGGGGFFSGLGGKPSEDAANKNPFGVASGGGFGQTSQPGANSLFGNSGAKGFGSSSFGEKPSGTFSTGASSVATQGFGSFTSPVKAGKQLSVPFYRRINIFMGLTRLQKTQL